MQEITVNLINKNTMQKMFVFGCVEYSINDDISALASSTFKIPVIYSEVKPSGKMLVIVLRSDGTVQHLGILRSISKEREITSDHYYNIFEEAVNMVNIGPRNTLWTHGDYVDFCMHQHFDRFHDIPGYAFDYTYKTGRSPFPSDVPELWLDTSGDPGSDGNYSIKQGGIDSNDTSLATFLQYGYTKNQEVLYPYWESGKIVFRYGKKSYTTVWNLTDDMDIIESTTLPDMWQTDGINAVYVYDKRMFWNQNGWPVDNYKPMARFYKDDKYLPGESGYDSNFPNRPIPHASSFNDPTYTGGYPALDTPARSGMTGQMNIKKLYKDIRTADEISDMVDPFSTDALSEFTEADVNYEVSISFRNQIRISPEDFNIGMTFTISIDGTKYTSSVTAIAYTQDENSPWTLKGGFKRDTVTGLVAASKGDLTGIATVNNTNKWVSTGIHARY